MEITEKKVPIIKLSTEDLIEVAKNNQIKYEVYWSYDDRLEKSTIWDLVDRAWKYADKEWKTFQEMNESFVDNFYGEIEEQIRERNERQIHDAREEQILDIVKKQYKDKLAEWYELDYDDVERMDVFEYCEYDSDIDTLLNRSYVSWNIVRNSNYDWFSWLEWEENEGYKQFMRLFPWRVDWDELLVKMQEAYSWDRLTISFCSTVKEMLDVIENWKFDLTWKKAVLHWWTFGSGSSEFVMKWWEIELWKIYEDCKYNRRDWELDTPSTWVVAVYGEAINGF